MDSIIAMAATALYTALQDFRGGFYVPISFKSATYRKFYTAYLTQIRSDRE
ncbi:hypothetical protein SERLA73DRAFT_142314 [Serpula lacrymans var. lacrymans S7.3]|uniref:DUF6532 domain-containing protein n=2 Tax=Serpula lacrymans var. lacrymans TaxID=341189 RepID=F8Q7K8_SERL3|nr:uncharacterized protein SERLADRAFT_398326 [Serpula lacrymans var. lacrymans S7.9]EGN95546.1 hypothetical protein SERLA73DRAFT_142314 [Serpula lacrymans var. lacrymans S7.3]EGO21072.1 hypothetical protein SERLADRAFT_398326 [Serpula lacrymans var. lacrymans S7.9]